MEIISQLIQNLNDLSKNIFFTTTNLETLLIKKDISSLLESLISNPEINDLISSINLRIYNYTMHPNHHKNNCRYSSSENRETFHE